MTANEPGLRYRYPDEPPLLDAKGLRAFAGRFRHRLVLLDFWASWCSGNQEDMSSLIELQDELGGESFQVISCNLDDPRHWSTQTVPLLNELRANYPCVVLTTESKEALRKWLDLNWSFDLPARFILDAQGRVVGRAFSSDALAEVQQEVRRLALASEGANGAAAQAPEAVTLRLKLIDLRRGRAIPMSDIAVDQIEGRHLAKLAYEQLSAEIDRRLNARIAVLPFLSLRGSSRANDLGRAAANELQATFQRHGYYDLIGPSAAERMLAQLGLTPMAIEFDPSAAQERLKCDFLILGWLSGGPDWHRDSRMAEWRGTADLPDDVAVDQVSSTGQSP